VKLVFPLPKMLLLKATAQPWEYALTGAEQTRIVKRADELGYDMVAVSEHFVIPRQHVELSGSHYFHSTAAQGYLAGATERMVVNSCITILPAQHPIVLAKALSTLDWMSNGRMCVTFGVGWLKEEFDLLGIPFHKRGRISEEYLAAIVELWTKEHPEFEGEFVSFKDVAFEPKPVQQPHLPIWMGGDSDAALRRAARYGSGWWVFLTPPEGIPARLDYLRSQPGYDDSAPFEVMYGMSTARVGEGHVVRDDDPGARPGLPKEEIIDRLSYFAELGVTYSAVPIPPVRDVEEYLDYSQWVIEEIKPHLP
jgi:probable F420-dependent oxidoreductase